MHLCVSEQVIIDLGNERRDTKKPNNFHTSRYRQQNVLAIS